ncbi:hypothetical protein D3C78_1507680 [compost metagenome]
MGQLGEVQWLQALLVDQARQLEMRGHHQVVPGRSRQGRIQIGSGVEGFVLDTDTAFALEGGEYLGLDVVGPVVDPQHLFALGETGQQAQQQQAERLLHGSLPPRSRGGWKD